MNNYLENLKNKLNIDLIGIVDNKKLSLVEDRILEIIEKGFSTSFEIDNLSKRVNPECVLPNVKSIFLIGMSYFWDDKNQGKYKISSYARGLDYHKILRGKLEELKKELEKEYEFNSVIHVDTGGFYEKELARKAGFGYFGKNSLLINEDFGSYFFIGCLFTDIDYKIYSKPLAGSCGTCNMCKDACPAKAIKGDYSVDFSICHSYLSQSKLDSEERKNIKFAYGCDICQSVCPKNKNIKSKIHEEFRPRIYNFDSINFFELSNKAFKREFSDYAFSWVGKKTIMRNIEIILNRG